MGWGVLWMDTKVGLWITNTNHKQFPNYYVSNKITILFEDCNYKNDANYVTT
jgi:hypothetical protein